MPEFMKTRYSIICASYLILIRSGKILMLRRFNTGYEDGKYSLPAGHVEGGESVAQTVIRETHEEVGIEIRKEDIKLLHVMHRKGTDHNDERLDFFFSCEKWSGEVKNCEPEKCDDLKWFPMEELPENAILYIKQAIESGAAGITYGDLNW